MTRGMTLLEVLLSLALLGGIAVACASWVGAAARGTEGTAQRLRWQSAADAALGVVGEMIATGDFRLDDQRHLEQPRVRISGGALEIDTRLEGHAATAEIELRDDRLMLQEAAHLSAQLPMLVRGIFFEGWRPAGKPVKERHRDQFVHRVRAALTPNRATDEEAVAAVRAVFAVLAERVSEGEIADVQDMLPQELREFWPENVGRRQ